MSRPPKFQLVDVKLDEDLATFLRVRRAGENGKPKPYDEIAYEIRQRTGVKVTGPTVSNWLDIVTAERTEAAS